MLDCTKDMFLPRSLALAVLLTMVSAFSEPGVPYIEGQGDVCSGYICLHGGSCINTTGQPLCACIVGFSGSRCEIVVNPPERSGQCPRISPDSTGQCPGDACVTDVVCPGAQKCCQTDCSTRVCADPIFSASSTGTESTSVCDYHVCLNGGSCQIEAGAPVCSCPDGYSGDRCQITAPFPVKDGQCPSLPARPNGDCTGTVCLNDAGCPGTKKCCQTGCYNRKICAEPETVRPTCDTLNCSVGSTCLVIRSAPGSEGEARCVLNADRTCWASGFDRALTLPSTTNMGEIDTVPCGAVRRFFSLPCPPGSSCSTGGVVGIDTQRICCSGRSNARRSLDAPARMARFQAQRRELDACGGCPGTQRCESVQVRCNALPCPALHLCVDMGQVPKCPLPCPAGHTCQMEQQSCDVIPCDPSPRPVCVPSTPSESRSVLGCPRQEGSGLMLYFYMCQVLARTSSTCHTDADCASLQQNVCCPTGCDAHYCMRATLIN